MVHCIIVNLQQIVNAKSNMSTVELHCSFSESNMSKLDVIDRLFPNNMEGPPRAFKQMESTQQNRPFLSTCTR